MRANRRNLPSLPPDNNLQRGESSGKTTKEGVACLKWKDKRCVMLLSSIRSPADIDVVNRKERDGSVTTIACPTMVKEYNSNMGFVDKADMLKSLYAIGSGGTGYYGT